MEVNINKEIRNYKEQLILGLDLKTCIIFASGLVIVIGEYIFFQRYLGLDSSITAPIYVVTALPIGFLALFKYNNMTAWQVAKVWFRYHFVQDQHLTFKPENFYFDQILSKRNKK